MYISRIKIRNWKNFKEVETSLGLRVFLIGPNASGKSNLLDVFRFLRDIANDGLDKAVGIRNGLSAIRCLAATRHSSIDIDVGLSEGDKEEWRYCLSLNQDNLQRPTIREEIVWRNDEELLRRPNESDKKRPITADSDGLGTGFGKS